MHQNNPIHRLILIQHQYIVHYDIAIAQENKATIADIVRYSHLLANQDHRMYRKIDEKIFYLALSALLIG